VWEGPTRGRKKKKKRKEKKKGERQKSAQFPPSFFQLTLILTSSFLFFSLPRLL
jgi:hypothetical protein